MNDGKSRREFATIAVIAATILLGACAPPPPPPPQPVPKGNVVLLPETDGKPTAVIVKQGDREIVLDQPYAASRVTSQGLAGYQSSQQDVEKEFGAALAA